MIKELGSGGMATVYLALQESVNREVALKIMAPALAADRDFSERFLKEAKIVAELQHPNIVGVFDMGVYNHLNYIVMEYVDAGDLKDNLEKGISSEQIFSSVLDVAEALSYAHGKGYVHRDVKSENILFRSNGSAVLSDFGIAKAVVSGTKMTGTGMSIGTPHYMSPEQARGQSLDGRADFYSLGIVLYEALAGVKPYDSEDTFAIGLMHINEPIPLLPENLSHYQPLIDNLCAKSPDNRYSHVNQVRKDFDAINAGQRFKRPKHATHVLKAHNKKSVSPLVWGIGGSICAAAFVTALYFYEEAKKTKARANSAMVSSQARIESLEASKNAQEVERKEELAQLLTQAKELLDKENYVYPRGSNAAEKFKQALLISPVNEKALSGLEKIASIYIRKAENSLSTGNYKSAFENLERGFTVLPGDARLAELNEKIFKKLGEERAAYEKQISDLRNLSREEQEKYAQLENEQKSIQSKLDELRAIADSGADLAQIKEFQKQKFELEQQLITLNREKNRQEGLLKQIRAESDELQKEEVERKKLERIPPP
nr:protein kinase [Alteromonas hispanica]